MATDRTTSFAKTVDGLVHEETALDRARRIKDHYHRAVNDNPPPKEKERETEKPPVGSQMIKDDRPVLRPTPSGSMRQPDRQVAYGRLAQEKTAENKKLDRARRMHEAFKARQGPNHTHEREQDRER